MKNRNIPTPREQVIPNIDNLFKSIVLISLLISFFYVAQLGADTVDSYFAVHPYPESVHLLVKWTFLLVLGVLNHFLLVGLAMQAHEAIHKVLFKSLFWNDLWGGILSALSLLPFYANREFHLTHHRYTHQPGLDPECAVHDHPFWFAFTMGGTIALYQEYKILVTNLLTRFGDKRYTGRVIKDVLFLLIAAGFYFYLIPLLGMSILYTFVPAMLATPFVFSFRTMPDHYGIPAIVKEKVNERVLEEDLEDLHRKYNNKPPVLDSWVVLSNPLMDWLWSHVHYQQVHHRYPYLSHCYLRSVFEATKHEQPYAVVHGYCRSLINLMNRPYYSQPEDIKPFLTTENLTKSV